MLVRTVLVRTQNRLTAYHVGPSRLRLGLGPVVSERDLRTAEKEVDVLVAI